eukprot:TRINITY_DN41775_c0_g1_i1.p2 TRINITY_DN41775_c0_g1~~TRINITY_DN41775_c0_g1_i1.p2  ORF type:complete len:167 (+),score=2.36 TRINITY_DN41775_c0_g1_i1:529-1029(+)
MHSSSAGLRFFSLSGLGGPGGGVCGSVGVADFLGGGGLKKKPPKPCVVAVRSAGWGGVGAWAGGGGGRRVWAGGGGGGDLGLVVAAVLVGVIGLMGGGGDDLTDFADLKEFVTAVAFFDVDGDCGGGFGIATGEDGGGGNCLTAVPATRRQLVESREIRARSHGAK